MAQIKVIKVGIQGPPGAGSSLPDNGNAGEYLQTIDGTGSNVQWTSLAPGSGNVTYTQGTQPGSTIDGDAWFNTTNGTYYVYANGGWQPQTLDGENF